MTRTLKSYLGIGSALVCTLGIACGSGTPHDNPIVRHNAIAPASLLGTAQDFAVLAGSTVTNTGSSLIDSSVGVHPGSSVTGFPPGILTGGAIHTADAVALQAQSDVTTAYNDLAQRPCTASLTGQDLAGKTLVAGVYCFTSSAQLTGTLVLDAENRADATFVFKIGSKLTVTTGSGVRLINGASPCNVFWQVGSSVDRIGPGATFVGSILALTSIAIQTGAQLDGRALARNGAVTLDTNRISSRNCGVAPVDDGGMPGDAGVDAGNNDHGQDGGIGKDAGVAEEDGGSGGGGGDNGGCCNFASSCGSACFNLQTDANNCGSCGTHCSASQRCSGGGCVTCEADRLHCKDQCADGQSDPFNCGACGNVCKGSQACVKGACAPCDGTVCSNACVELRTDRNNCGACGNVCGNGQCCNSGVCSSTRADGMPSSTDRGSCQTK